IDYEKIVLACRIIRSGAEWWASNPDYSLLTEIGRVPGNGAFVDLISRLTETEPIIVGKPAPHMMEFAAGRLGAHRPLMVGDRLDTDIEGGRAAGFDTALVLTGIHDIHDALAAAPERRPTFILPSLRGLEALIDGHDRSGTEIEARLRRAWETIDAGETDAEAVLTETDLPRTITEEYTCPRPQPGHLRPSAGTYPSRTGGPSWPRPRAPCPPNATSTSAPCSTTSMSRWAPCEQPRPGTRRPEPAGLPLPRSPRNRRRTGRRQRPHRDQGLPRGGRDRRADRDRTRPLGRPQRPQTPRRPRGLRPRPCRSDRPGRPRRRCLHRRLHPGPPPLGPGRSLGRRRRPPSARAHPARAPAHPHARSTQPPPPRRPRALRPRPCRSDRPVRPRRRCLHRRLHPGPPPLGPGRSLGRRRRPRSARAHPARAPARAHARRTQPTRPGRLRRACQRP